MPAPAFHPDDLDWTELRGLAVTNAAFKTLVDDAYTGGAYGLELTRIAPGGCSPEHTEPWSHLFYVVSGEGALDVDGRKSSLRAGSVAPIRAGERHSLVNTGDEDLVMLVIYHPPRKRRTA
jgi:quercetin dioxygenase-like cupin family protein